jgi:hypothetical protein
VKASNLRSDADRLLKSGTFCSISASCETSTRGLLLAFWSCSRRNAETAANSPAGTTGLATEYGMGKGEERDRDDGGYEPRPRKGASANTLAKHFDPAKGRR